MIERLNRKKALDILDFIQTIKDSFEDFYITENNERKFLKTLKFINKVLKYQSVFGLYRNGLKAIAIIYRTKGYRTYLKLLTSDYDSAKSMLRFLSWEVGDIDLYVKIKRNNFLSNILQKNWYSFVENRGEEILLLHKKRELIKLFPKECDLIDETRRLY